MGAPTTQTHLVGTLGPACGVALWDLAARVLVCRGGLQTSTRLGSDQVVVGCNYPAFRRLSREFRAGAR